jgi:hypothetical protein
VGLKGYRLWVNLIQPAEPHRGGGRDDDDGQYVAAAGLRVAVQVDSFERKELKPVFHLKG